MSTWLENLIQYWTAGGPLLIPLAAVCFCIWLFFLRTRRQLIRQAVNAEQVVASVRHNRIEQVLELPGSVADLLRESFSSSTPSQADIFDEGCNRFLRLLRRDIIVLAAFTAVAPLLGLLGTVIGMIETFDAVAATSGETAARVASGVSSALITTQVGLVIAIPGFFGLARLRRLSHHLQVQLGAIKLHAILLRGAL
jgi:biopolymer transport protein ExbB